MAYLELQDFIDELGEDILIQLTDNDGIGEVNESRVEKAIQYASGVFDAYARGRYSIPVPATPMVKATCLDLAIFHLYKSRTSITEGVYEVRSEANDNAIKLLTAINTGKAGLDVPRVEETKTNPQTSDSILTNKDRAKFNDKILSNY